MSKCLSWYQTSLHETCTPCCVARRTHLADGFFEWHDPLFSHVLTKDTRVSTVGARMNDPFWIIRVSSFFIGSEFDPWLAHLELDVILGHHEVYRADALLLGEEEIDHRIDPILPL